MTQHTATGAGAPTTVPPSLSAHYTDTVTGDLYIANGTASAADWGQPINEPARVITESAASFTLTPAHRVVLATSPVGDGSMTITLPVVVSGRWHHEIYLSATSASDRQIDLVQPAEQVNPSIGGDPALADGTNTGSLGNTARLSQPPFTRWRLVLDRAGEAGPWSVQVLDVNQFQSIS